MYTAADSPSLYPDVPAILDGLRARGVLLALASRTPTPHVANAFIDKLELRHRFCSVQLIPAADGFDQHSAQKDKAHLPNIQRETGLPYSSLLFFDDERGNVQKVSMGNDDSHVAALTRSASNVELMDPAKTQQPAPADTASITMQQRQARSRQVGASKISASLAAAGCGIGGD